jgi:hypothetical protein
MILHIIIVAVGDDDVRAGDAHDIRNRVDGGLIMPVDLHVVYVDVENLFCADKGAGLLGFRSPQLCQRPRRNDHMALVAIGDMTHVNVGPLLDILTQRSRTGNFQIVRMATDS